MPRTDLYGESVFHVRIVSNIVNGFFGVVAVPRNLRVPPVVVPPVVVPPEAGVVPPEAAGVVVILPPIFFAMQVEGV